MGLRGRILNVSRDLCDGSKEYVCVSDVDGRLELIPVAVGEEAKITEVPAERGPGFSIVSVRMDDTLVERVKKRCKVRMEEIEGQGLAQSSAYKSIAANLKRLNRVAPDPVKQSFVGKLVFLEIPFEKDRDCLSGEYIVIQHTQDSLYVVDTYNCHAALELKRIKLTDGDDQAAIVDVYEDDDFIQNLAERLDDMATDDFEAIDCDTAETVSRMLTRLLENKRSRVSALDLLFAQSANFLGSIA